MKIYYARMDGLPKEEEMIKHLSFAERQKALGMKRESSRKLFIGSRFLLRQMLNDQDGEIMSGKGGKPFVKGNDIEFNLSHSKEMIAVAVDSFPVGIDIEYMKTRNFKGIVKTFPFLDDKDKDSFYKSWTRYEASVKLYGKGIFEKHRKEPKFLKTEKIGNYMVSVASDRTPLPDFLEWKIREAIGDKR